MLSRTGVKCLTVMIFLLFAILASGFAFAGDLNLTMPGYGRGTVTFSQGYNCSSTCRQAFDSATTLTLTATPDAYSTFTGWSGCDTSVNTTCTISMASTRNVSAYFDRAIPGTGIVNGTITDYSGAGLPNLMVRLMRQNETSCMGPACLFAYTDSLGYYSFGSLVPGSYIAMFYNPPVQFGPYGGMTYTTNQYYNNKHSIASADLIPVSEGSLFEANAVYPLSGQISGTVTDTNGAGIANASIRVSNLDEEMMATGWTDAAGNYTLHNLPSGTYKVRFRGNVPAWQMPGRNFMPQVVYVPLTAPDSVTGINATLSPGRNISGRITNIDGLPIAATATVSDLYGNIIGSGSTDASGAYSVMGIPPGSYRVFFHTAQGMPWDPTRLYSQKFYGGDPYVASVTVTADSDVFDINGVLEVRGPALNVMTFKDFGIEVAGVSSSHRSFRVQNRGTADLVLGTISKTGDEFSIQNDRCSGVSLAPSQMCTFQVEFAPITEGAKTGSVSVPSNDPDFPVINISIWGSGGAGTGDSGTIMIPANYANTPLIINDVSVTFLGSVISSGEDTLTSTAITTLDSPIPLNFRLLNGASYDIATTAIFEGQITVCINYDPATMSNPANEPNLKLFHYDNLVGSWADITTTIDTVAHTICGVTDSLSPFVVAEPLSAEELIDSLVETVNAMDLKQGITTSLDAKLQAAVAALSAARSNDMVTACNLMNAFTNEVLAQSGKQITVEQANQLLSESSLIKGALNCP